MFVITMNQSAEKICSLRGLGLHRRKKWKCIITDLQPWLEKEINNKCFFSFFFHSPKWSSTSIQVHKCQHLFVFFFCLAHISFIQTNTSLPIKARFQIVITYFAAGFVLEGLDLQLFIVGKYPARLSLLFRLRHFASQSVQALSDKSVPFQRAVTSETAKAWIKLWAWPRFGNLRKS